MKRNTTTQLAAVMAFVAVQIPGCTHYAEIELIGADSLDAAAQALESAFDEYHAEIKAGDAHRRQLSINEFVSAITDNGAEDDEAAQHVANLIATLDRHRENAELENVRYLASGANLQLIRGVAADIKHRAGAVKSARERLIVYLSDYLDLQSSIQSRQP